VLDMVLLTKVPGMTVFAPSSYQELQVMLHDALEITSGPSAIRWPKTAARVVPEDEVGHGLHARLVRSGDDVALVGVGKMLGACLEAADRLTDAGVSCQVWDPRVVKPLDPDLISDLARFPLVITVEDGLREGGAGSAIADAVSRCCTDPEPGAADSHRDAPVVRVLGTPVDYLPHGKADQILAGLGLDAEGISAEVKRLLRAPAVQP
jgi:1-deoxy-D-xylulose-5-phosphate synthase